MILVTGAGGTVGTALVEALRADGQAVRAAHHSAEKAERARQDGQDAVQIDLAAPETLPLALEGVEAVFLLATGIRGQIEQEVNLVEAAKAYGIKRLVKLSVWRAAEEEYALAKMHRTIEKVVEASGLAWTLLRPNGFMQNFTNHMAGSIRSKGAFFQPAIDAPISHIDVRDIARVAATVLTSSGHEGKAYELSGPNGFSYVDAARILSDKLGTEIVYVPLTDEAARAGMVGAGMPDFYADAMLNFVRAYRTGIAAYVSEDVRNVLGREPIAFEQFVRDHADAFDASRDAAL